MNKTTENTESTEKEMFSIEHLEDARGAAAFDQSLIRKKYGKRKTLFQ